MLFRGENILALSSFTSFSVSLFIAFRNNKRICIFAFKNLYWKNYFLARKSIYKHKNKDNAIGYAALLFHRDIISCIHGFCNKVITYCKMKNDHPGFISFSIIPSLFKDISNFWRKLTIETKYFLLSTLMSYLDSITLSIVMDINKKMHNSQTYFKKRY